MEFAKKQLQKFGWKEGEGLGKTKNGISKAIRVPLKFDKGGLGHNEFEDENDTWWKRLYDDAAKKLIIKKDSNNEVAFEKVENLPKRHPKRKRTSSENKELENAVYKNFVKESKFCEPEFDEKKINNNANICKEESKKINRDYCYVIKDLTDEELLEVCEGRTAHKGARFGLKMNAKLKRLKQQENSFEADFNNEIGIS